MRTVKTTKKFDKTLVEFLAHHPELILKTEHTIAKITRNPFDQSLKTHKLSGQLRYMYAASITYSYRILFICSPEEICFVNIGSHDDLY